MGWPDFGESTYWALRPQVSARWPELGFYDVVTGAGFGTTVPEEIGDAIDDLTDIADEFARALRFGEENAVWVQDLLCFTLDSHWGEHVQGLVHHLDWLIRQA